MEQSVPVTFDTVVAGNTPRYFYNVARSVSDIRTNWI